MQGYAISLLGFVLFSAARLRGAAIMPAKQTVPQVNGKKVA
jgi:hypothetical protein